RGPTPRRGPSRVTTARRDRDVHVVTPARPLCRGGGRVLRAFLQARAPQRPSGDGAARRGRPRPHLPHRHADDGGGLRAAGRDDGGDLGVRLAARPRLPVRRADDRRAGDGRVRHGAARGADDPAGTEPADRRAAGAAAQPAVHGARARHALRLRQLRAGVRARHHLRAAVQGNQGQAPRLLLHAAAVAADARQDERPRHHRRLGVPERRAPDRRDLGVADRKILFALLSWGTYTFALFARRTIGWSGRRAAWLSAIAFVIVLLNLLPVGY